MFNIELGSIKHTIIKLAKPNAILGTLHSSSRLEICS